MTPEPPSAADLPGLRPAPPADLSPRPAPPADLSLRSRRRIIVGGAVAVVVEQAAGLRFPQPAYVTAGAAAVLLLVAALVVGWRRNRHAPATFVVDERTFRTPTHVAGPLLAVSVLHIAGLFLALTRESVPTGLAGAALFLAVLAGSWSSAWNGTWIALHPDRLVAGKQTGILTVAWDALSPEQPGRGEEWHEIRLGYADRDRATTTGRFVNRDEVNVEATNADLVAKAIATYAGDPGRRTAIGTAAELERLREDLPDPPRGLFEAPEPAPTRTTVRRLVATVALFAVAILVGSADNWVHLLSTLFTFAAAAQLLSAYRGWRAARRARTVV